MVISSKAAISLSIASIQGLRLQFEEFEEIRQKIDTLGVGNHRKGKESKVIRLTYNWFRTSRIDAFRAGIIFQVIWWFRNSNGSPERW